MKKKIQLIKLYAVKEGEIEYGKAFHTPKDAVEVIRPFMEYLSRETIVVCTTDVRLNPLSAEVVGIGSLSQCIVSPKEILKSAITSNAAGIYIFHNHPSGDSEASEEDYQCTKRIKAACELMDIILYDHIIIGRGGNYFSFKEQGVLL